MKKFGIALLSLGLVAVFSMSAFAVVPELTGEYYARGSYLSNPSMLPSDGGKSRGPFSYYDQRLRVFTRLKIADGLSLTTRMDALEDIWGQNTNRHSFCFLVLLVVILSRSSCLKETAAVATTLV